MPTKPTKGKAQLSTQVQADLLGQFREYVRGRGETLTAGLERAMRREMAYPPPAPEPPPLPPLPDAVTTAAPTKKGPARGKKT